MEYVTYEPSTGALTGGYSQNLVADHAHSYIEVLPEVRASWVMYRANEARDGVELIDVIEQPPGDSPISIPGEVTRREGLQALLDENITESMVIDKIIELTEEGQQRERALIDFRAAATFERNNPLVIMLGAAFALDLDAVFTRAKTYAPVPASE